MRTWMLAAALVAVALPEARAQDLATRVAAVKDGSVAVRFAPREGVCGDGSRWARIGRSTYGEWNGADAARQGRCEPGPVRVVARLEGGVVRELRTTVGAPLAALEAGTTDFGVVAAPDAARWLLGVARTAPGRASSRAIMPAVIADSATVWRELLAIARDTTGRPRETRREASFWLSRLASAASSGHPGTLDDDEDDERLGADVRAKREAVFALSQLRANDGVPALVTIARTHKEPAVRSSALFWLGQSGDARALAVFEEILVGH